MIRLGRPLFLTGGFLMHTLGAVMALYAGASLDIPALLWGQIAVTATQLMTQYSNEYFDLPADRANTTPTRWTGGSQVLPAGELPPEAALGAGVACGLVALGATLLIAAVVKPGPLALPLLLLAMFLAWEYSAPPLHLHSRGLGELTVAIVVPGLTPLVGFYLQAGRLALLPFLAVAPLLCLQFASMLTIEFPDAVSDAASGKRTLVVRLGGARAARLHGAALVATYAMLPLLAVAGLPPLVGIAAGSGAPIAAWHGWRALRGGWSEEESWESLAFWGIGLLVGTAAAEMATFAWLLWRSGPTIPF